MKSIQPSRRDFGSGGIFPGVKTPGYFQASFPDAKTDGTCEPPADEVAPKRSLGHWRFGCYNYAAPLALRGKGRRMKRGGFAILRVLRLISAFFSNFCSARPSAWTVSTRADALSTSADGKSTCALVIGRRAGSPSTCAFAVGTRAFASRPRAFNQSSPAFGGSHPAPDDGLPA